MRWIAGPAFAAAIFALCLPASAETCREKFMRVMVGRNEPAPGVKPEDHPMKIRVITEIKGQKPMTNWHYSIGKGHWMTEMIDPPNLPSSLVYDNVMFYSTDKGKTWKKIRNIEKESKLVDHKKRLRDAAASAKNEVCGEELLDGVKHETVAADYVYADMDAKFHETFWVNPATGWVTKARLHTVQPGFESVTTQFPQKAPGLTLPTPK
jgi:hypothetical protein